MCVPNDMEDFLVTYFDAWLRTEGRGLSTVEEDPKLYYLALVRALAYV